MTKNTSSNSQMGMKIIGTEDLKIILSIEALAARIITQNFCTLQILFFVFCTIYYLYNFVNQLTYEVTFLNQRNSGIGTGVRIVQGKKIGKKD